ncbi:LacI family DNA-binding transcriptional regulator [Nonomuraea sp. NPDC050404]|uniref:LacI family DNA-binding transcriptional regulator n=1 Tax=Nonomuraea sp. NPDC050404 TaxID=3155783 RepID=UPI003407AEEB
MQGRPTINDVAQAAGVSKSAVSYALSGRGRIGAETRERVLAVAAELGWQPSQQARGLSSSRTYAVGLVFARPAELIGADPFFAPFIAGVEAELSHHKYALLSQVIVGGEAEEEEGYRRLVSGGRVDGMILTDLRDIDPRIGLLRDLGMPYVAVGRPMQAIDGPAVSNDDSASVTAAVDHLADLGHQRIAQVSGSRALVHGLERERAFHRALAARGLYAGTVIPGDFTGQSGAEGMCALLELSPRPTAIIFANGLMAIAGMQEAARQGVSVPADVSVVALDDNPIAPFVTPALTAVHTDVLLWGSLSARTIMACIEGEPDTADVVLTSELVVRGSTAPPPPPA